MPRRSDPNSYHGFCPNQFPTQPKDADPCEYGSASQFFKQNRIPKRATGSGSKKNPCKYGSALLASQNPIDNFLQHTCGYRVLFYFIRR